MKKVAAVVLNYNTPKDTINCVNLLKSQKDVDLLPIVVDNKSTDDSIEIFKRELDARLIKNNENKGYSAGNNLGLKKAIEESCEYALIINPDVEVKDDKVIKKCLDVMEAKKDVALVGPDIIEMDGSHQNPLRELKFWEDFLWPLAVLCNRRSKKSRYVMDYTKSGYCEKVFGCCFLVRLEAIKDIGYLDESVFLYSEEPILAAMLKEKNYKIYYIADVEVFHKHVEKEKGDATDRTYQYFTSRYYYLKNYKYKGLKRKLVCASCRIERKIITSKQ